MTTEHEHVEGVGRDQLVPKMILFVVKDMEDTPLDTDQGETAGSLD